MEDLELDSERRKQQRAAIEKLVADCVRMNEYEPGKYWALINLPGQTSKTLYTGCVEGHAKMLCSVAQAAMIHALQYATQTSEGIGEEAYADLHARGFVHYALDYKRHGVEIANAISALQVALPAVASATPVSEGDASYGDTPHPPFLTVPPSAIAEFETEVERG